jgi:transposase
MPIIRQDSLFDMQILYDLEPTHRFNAVLSGIDIYPILDVVMKKSRYGQPQTLNYAAMIYSLIIRITDRIPFIKDLLTRLEKDLKFKIDCVFLVSDEIPSEASYSRMITLISESDALEIVQERLLLLAM